MVRVKMNDGTEVLLGLGWDEFREAFDEALAKGRALSVNGANGKVWAINPTQISYFEVVDPALLAAIDPEAVAAANGAHPGSVVDPSAVRT